MDFNVQIFDDVADKLFDSGQIRRVLSSMGEAVLDAMVLNIATKGHGTWASLAPSTIAEKRRGGYPLEPLIRTWHMSQSLNRGGADNVFDVTDTTVEVGTRTSYAQYHAFGQGRMHRDFSEMLPSDWDNVGKALDAWIGAAQ
jgi:hypothetical protein